MFNQITKFRGKVEDDNPYWISFSDIMAGLLVIFILAALLLIQQLTQQQDAVDKKVEEIEKANKIRSELLGDVQRALEHQGIIVEISDNESVIRIPSSTLNFASNHAEIPSQQQEVVEKIGIALVEAIIMTDRINYVDTIFVEGHTDSARSDYKGVGNWLLSADRAISIWQYWGDKDTTNRLWGLKNFRDELMFSVSGYGKTRRVEVDDSTDEEKVKNDEKKAKNRRIDLRFTMKQPRKCDYQEVSGAASC